MVWHFIPWIREFLLKCKGKINGMKSIIRKKYVSKKGLLTINAFCESDNKWTMEWSTKETTNPRPYVVQKTCWFLSFVYHKYTQGPDIDHQRSYPFNPLIVNKWIVEKKFGHSKFYGTFSEKNYEYKIIF